MDKIEKAPGFFEIDPVAYRGHTLKSEHGWWTLTATDVYLGWTENFAFRGPRPLLGRRGYRGGY